MKLVKLTHEVGVLSQDEEKQRDLIGEFVLNKYPNELTQKAIVADLKQFSLWLQEKFWALLETGDSCDMLHLARFHRKRSSQGPEARSIPLPSPFN